MSVYPIHCLTNRFGMYCPSAAKEARNIIKKFDIVYVINWYYHLGMVFAKISNELKIPLIVGPMASLEDVARSTKKRQKMIADRIYTNDMLKNSNGFHCVGNKEKPTLASPVSTLLSIDSKPWKPAIKSILLSYLESLMPKIGSSK